MPIHADLHTHSSFSSDCVSPLDEMIARAQKLGLTHYCITEHMDMDYPVHPTDQLDFQLDTESYLLKARELRSRCPESFHLLIGVELGLQPHLAERIRAYTSQYDFDFIIGSSHLCHGKDPYYPAFYEGRSEEEAYREYFSSILENIIAIDDFDVYGHLDYVVRYGPNKDTRYSYENYRDILDAILQLLLEKGKGIEINTGGLKYGLKELHPCTALIRRYKELGGEIITIGSDAHKPEAIAAHFSRVEEILKNCGFNYYTVFKERKPQFIRL
ncbi:MAG: histidinol-phosphatase HisJ family protein [Lachnospiraceae bacterium]|nr:histidinol-phosphatase HisJ family protein [Lachnospiraceae bacterium]